MFDHELRPILGRAKYEIENLTKRGIEASRVEAELGRIEKVLDTFRVLGQAARPSQSESFDIVGLIEDIAEEVRRSHPVSVDLVGARPFTVTGDQGLVRLILINAMRNAADSVQDVRGEARRDPEVVVNWDANDSEYWIAVLDEGGGLPEHRERIFEPGITTRQDHLGMGLVIARQAAHSLGGEISLESREPRGARFFVSWSRGQVANTVS